MRTGKALIDATRPFASERRGASWWYVASTLAVLVAAEAVAAVGSVPGSVRLLAAVAAGLVAVRAFILYHDFLHGALLGGSSLARAIMYAYGVLVLTPPRVWRQTHNYHHAHTAQLVGSHVGSYAMVTPEMWGEMSGAQRLVYKITRHPLNMVVGMVTIFLYGMCFSSFVRDPKRHWDSLVAIGVHGGLTGLLWAKFGFATYAFAMLIPLAIACASGAYLFYAQHNFPGVKVQPRAQWEYAKAALESSSYMETGPILGWLTGNIGYHHVHHLNPTIPFYRLAEAMAGIPELQDPPTTSLRPKDVWACLKLKLWDPERGEMIGYGEAGGVARGEERKAA